jgi:hypothetical protein
LRRLLGMRPASRRWGNRQASAAGRCMDSTGAVHAINAKGRSTAKLRVGGYGQREERCSAEQ